MIYDVIILGAGPAGLSAAVYTTRYNLDTLVIGKGPGLMAEADEICNYLGFSSISGSEMDSKFREHAENLGVEIKREEVRKLGKDGDFFITKTDKAEYKSRTLVYALGGTKRRMPLPEEEKFRGRGLSYCATCDGAFFRDKIVAVTGGRNSAVMSALMLSRLAKKVYLIYRRDKLRAFPSLIKKMEENENIEIIFNSNIKEIKGDKTVEKVVLENLKTGESSEMAVNGVFVEFGHIPNSDLVKDLGVETTDKGRINVSKDMSTNVRGVFAAGDVTTGSSEFEQVVTAAADGAIAARSVYKLISEVD